MEAVRLFVFIVLWEVGNTQCPAGNLNLNVVFLNEGDLGFPAAFDEFRLTSDPIPDCVTYSPANVDVITNLELPEQGWTKIKSELEFHGRSDKLETHVVVGPYYTNIAMMLEQLNVTYLVTAGKGYDWIDMNRIDDPVKWATMVELTPSARDQNRAVVDLFLSKHWLNAIMIMPEENDEECRDLAHQMIEKKIALIPFSIMEESSVEMIKAVLRTSQLLSQKQILICSPHDAFDNLILKVLTQAKKSGMFDKPDLVFTIVEPYSLLHALSGINNTYQLGLFGVQCQLLSFRYIHPQIETLDRYEALAADSALVIGKAVADYLHDGNIKFDEFTSQILLKYIKKVGRSGKDLVGKTGLIEFNRDGSRDNYTLHLYRHGGQNLFQKIGEWKKTENSSKGILTFEEETVPEEDKSDVGIFPSVVKVVVVLDSPFVMKRENSVHQHRPFTGFSIDLLERLAKDLHFDYEVYQAPNNSYGVMESDGRWTGMVGEVLNGKATFALGALTITSQREDYIDFTHGIITSGSNILIPKPRNTLSIFQFLKPFSPALWVSILSAFFLLCCMFFILDSQRENRQFTAKECMWFGLGVLLMRGTDFSPKSTPQRILTSGYMFFALITLSTYTANMAAFLTTVNLETTVESFEDLAKTDTLAPLTVSNSSTMSYLKSSKHLVVAKVWEKILSGGGIVPSASEAVSRVAQGGHALVFDYRVNEFAEQTVCDTTAVGLPVLRLEHGIGLPPGAPYKGLLDIAIIKLQESGYINMLLKKWWLERRKCDKESRQRTSRDANFRISHMAGIFIVGCAGLCLSVVFFFTKKMYLQFYGHSEEGKPVDNPEGVNESVEFTFPSNQAASK